MQKNPLYFIEVAQLQYNMKIHNNNKLMPKHRYKTDNYKLPLTPAEKEEQKLELIN